MSTSQIEPRVSPPRYIASLGSGFNAVASHVYLVLFPIAIDLFLWFGPLVRVKDLFAPAFEQSLSSMASNSTPETIELVRQSQTLWTEILTHFNLFSVLRTFPIGIPSLMAFQGAITNPLGNLKTMDIENGSMMLLFAVAASLAGIAIGALYFALVARAALTKKETLTSSTLAGLIVRSLQLSLMILAAVVLIVVPLICGASLMLMLLPQFGSIPLIAIGMLLIWLVLPLVFTPHGIFSSSMNPVESLRFSFKLVRKFLPGTSTFMLLAILISYGLNFLWTTPEPEQWLLGVGIIGHAFITTGVLAATFVYYERGVEWMNEIIRLRETQQKPPAVS